MDILIFALGIILCLTGIVGSFLPVIPGPITSWFGILILNLTDAVPFNLKFVLITLSVAVLVFLVDFVTHKKYYDPRVWLRKSEEAFVDRLERAFRDLNNINTL